MHVLSLRSTIRSVISAWLDAYPDDFRDPPHYSALRRLRQFAVDQLPDSDLHRRVAGRLALLRRQETVQRRPQSAGAQRQRASIHASSFFLVHYYVVVGLVPLIVVCLYLSLTDTPLFTVTNADNAEEIIGR